MVQAAYLQPDTLEDALGLLAQGQMTVAAGCTDLFAATERQVLPGPVMDVTRVQGLRGIGENREGWRIGAASTWSDILAANLPPAFDMLRQAAREVGSVQIQNSGTVGGNICNASPAADGVPPLLALDASVEIASRIGRRELPLAEFVTGVRQTALQAGEMVTAVLIPRRAGEGASRFLKLGARRYLVISIAMVAVRLAVRDGLVSDCAIAVGACSPVARRLPELEAAIASQPFAELTLPKGLVTKALAPIADVRGSAEYRGEAAEVLVARALSELAGTMA